MAHLLLQLSRESSHPSIACCPLSPLLIPFMQHGQSGFDPCLPHSQLSHCRRKQDTGKPIAVALEYPRGPGLRALQPVSPRPRAEHESSLFIRLCQSPGSATSPSLAALVLQQPPCWSPAFVPCQALLPTSPRLCHFPYCSRTCRQFFPIALHSKSKLPNLASGSFANSLSFG